MSHVAVIEHVLPSAAPPAETRSWHKNCITQTTSWSPCSKTCGRGLSLRISNANERCELIKESRLCNLRPCEVDISKHIKVESLCLSASRPLIKTACSPASQASLHPLVSFFLSAGKEVSEHLQGGAARQPHHLRLHQQEAVPAQILRRVHGRALLHPLQIQNHRRGVRMSQRQRLHLEDDVGPGLFLQPELQKPQRHLRRPGELLRLPGSHELMAVNQPVGSAFFFLSSLCS